QGLRRGSAVRYRGEVENGQGHRPGVPRAEGQGGVVHDLCQPREAAHSSAAGGRGTARGHAPGPFGIIDRKGVFANSTLQSYVGIEGDAREVQGQVDGEEVHTEGKARGRTVTR